MNYFTPIDIRQIKQNLEIGDVVRCYDEEMMTMQSFVGYGKIEKILNKDENYCWCVSDSVINDIILKELSDKNKVNFRY